MLENMCSKTFGLLMNQVGQEEAYAKLESYKSIKPRVSCTIQNYHYEQKEVIDKVIKPVEKDIKDLRDAYVKELAELKVKRTKLKAEINEEKKMRDSRGAIARLLDTKNKDLNVLESQLDLLD